MKDEKILDKEGTDIVEKQIMSPIGDSDNGNIIMTDRAKEELGEQKDVQTIIELLNKDAKDSFSPKYQEELANKAKDDPTSVMIETPEGWMTIAQAMKKGFNPESGKFDGESVEQRIDRIIKEQGLDPDEASRIKQMVLKQEATNQPKLEGPEVPLGKGQPNPEEQPAKPNEGEQPAQPTEGAKPVEGAKPEVDPALLAAISGGGK